nr:hypothetical protein BaRGS_006621 [Batillaria attramentaria]
MLKTGNEYVTNLPLQMLIYFNVFFSPLWFITSIVMLQAKFNNLSELYQIVLISVYIVYTLIEIVRLYLGFVGNLMERVPELAGFWLLTILLQFPLILLLVINDGAILLPLERAVHIVKALFVFSEVIVGYLAIRVMVNYQVCEEDLRLHPQQVGGLDEQTGLPIIVEIDESKYFHRKYHRGQWREGHWLGGGIYLHDVIVHDQHLVDPNIHTNNIKNTWMRAKRKLRRQFGMSEDLFLSYLACGTAWMLMEQKTTIKSGAISSAMRLNHNQVYFSDM